MKHACQLVGALSLLGFTFSVPTYSEESAGYTSYETAAQAQVTLLINEIVVGPNPELKEYEVQRDRAKAIAVIRTFLDEYRKTHRTSVHEFKQEHLSQLAATMLNRWSRRAIESDFPSRLFEEILSELGNDFPIESLLEIREVLVDLDREESHPDPRYALWRSMLVDVNILISVRTARQIQIVRKAKRLWNLIDAQADSEEEAEASRLESMEDLQNLLRKSNAPSLILRHPHSFVELSELLQELDTGILTHMQEALPVLEKEIGSETGCDLILGELQNDGTELSKRTDLKRGY